MITIHSPLYSCMFCVVNSLLCLTDDWWLMISMKLDANWKISQLNNGIWNQTMQKLLNLCLIKCHNNIEYIRILFKLKISSQLSQFTHRSIVVFQMTEFLTMTSCIFTTLVVKIKMSQQSALPDAIQCVVIIWIS